MSYPKISIVTPSFNQAPYLEETLLSVIGQNYPNLEYIVIDGGSTDGSVDIIRKYEKHLAYWISEKDKGMYDAIQKGFARSTGEIMGWINSDDRYFPKSFFVLADIFAGHPEVQWLQANPSLINEEGQIVGNYSSRKWSRYHFYMYDYKYIQQESTFWRRNLWVKAGSSLRTDLKLAGDFELWLRFFDHADLYTLHSVLGAFRIRSSNQFSLDKLEEYNAECETEISKKVESLNPDCLKNLRYLKMYWSFYSRIPFLKGRMKNKFNRILASPTVVYDRKSQSFITK